VKVLNVIAIALSVLLIGLSFYYSRLIFTLSLIDDIEHINLYYLHKAELLTVDIGYFSYIFFFTFLLLYLIQVKKYKSVSFIGILITLIIMFLDYRMLSNIPKVGFFQFSREWMAYGAVNIVLFILLLRKKKFSNKQESDEVIDDLLI